MDNYNQNDIQHDIQENPKKPFFKKFANGAVFILMFFLIFFAGYRQGKLSEEEVFTEKVPINDAVLKNKNSEKEVDFDLYWEVWDILKKKHVDRDSLDANKMLYGSINGMLYSTGDPYSTFFSAEEVKQFNEEISGNFEGIGAELGIKEGILTIIAPLEGTPAQKAGLRSGDKIVKIDGVVAAEMILDEAVSKIRGQKGTKVKLTIVRENIEGAFDVDVERDVITVKSVKYEIKEGNVPYIKISKFGDDTEKDFYQAINKAVALNPKGMVLDLRNNPGGYLDASINMASKLLPKGSTVLITEDAEKNHEKELARGGDVASGIRTIVLINEGSASASEILAGAIRENRENVTLLGKKTFGKGSVQEMKELPRGTAVKITIERWLTPNGNQINEKGISPDMEVDLTDDDYENDRDPQLEKALEILK